MKESKKCIECGKELSKKHPCGEPRRRFMFCSHLCASRHRSIKVPLAEAIALYESGMTQTEIAKRYGTSQVIIYGLFKRNGYKCRKITYRQAGAKNPRWRGDGAGYDGLHTRVKRARGRASEYQCVECGRQAQDWANVTGEYSNVNDYAPMCKSCHRKFDLAHPGKKGKAQLLSTAK